MPFNHKTSQTSEQIPTKDLIDIVRRYAEREGWCDEAEKIITRKLKVDFEVHNYDYRLERYTNARMTITADSPTHLSKTDVAQAITFIRRVRRGYSTKPMIDEIITKFGIEAATQYNDSYTVTFTVNEDSMRRQGWEDDPSTMHDYLRYAVRNAGIDVITRTPDPRRAADAQAKAERAAAIVGDTEPQLTPKVPVVAPIVSDATIAESQEMERQHLENERARSQYRDYRRDPGGAGRLFDDHDLDNFSRILQSVREQRNQ